MKIINYHGTDPQSVVLHDFEWELHIAQDFPGYEVLSWTFAARGFRSFPPDTLQRYLLDKERIDFINACQQKHHLPKKVIVLGAHGGEKNNKWVYFDGKKANFIQGFISRHENDACLIIIASCNERKREVISNRALVVASSKIVGGVDLFPTMDENYAENGMCSWNLFYPHNVVVNDYTLAYETKRLLEASV